MAWGTDDPHEDLRVSFGRPESGSATKTDGTRKQCGREHAFAPSRRFAAGLAAALATLLIALPAGLRADDSTGSAEVLLPVAPPPGIPVDDDPVYTIATDPEPGGDDPAAALADPDVTVAPDTAAAAAMSATIEDLVNRDLSAAPPEGWSGPALVPPSTSAALGQLQQPLLAPESPDGSAVAAAQETAATSDPVPTPQEVAAPPSTAVVEPASTVVAAEPVVVTGAPPQQPATKATAAAPVADAASKPGKPAKAAVRSSLGAKKKKPAAPAVAPSAIPFDNARARN